MTDVDAVWNALAAGTGEPPQNAHVRKLLLLRARHAADQTDESTRREALQVLRRLGGTDTMGVAASFSADPSLDIRRRLLAMAKEAGPEGTTVVRKLIMDPEPDVVLQALERLSEVQDRGATTGARSLLTRPEPAVRIAAAVYLGAFGGVSIVPVLRPLLGDSDEQVAAAARQAIAHLEGTPSAADREPARPPEAPRSPERPQQAPTAPPVQTAQGREIQVPTKVLDLFHHLASFPDRRAHLVEALRKADERELSEAFRNRKPGQTPDLNLGAALAAAELGNNRWLAPVRKLTSDPDSRVRAAVAKALGALCTPAVLTSLEELVLDADPAVHRSALEALVDGARRVGAVPAARRVIQGLSPVEDEGIKAARAAALAALGT
jgi:hypothetical protein